MTPEELAEVEERCRKATAGPWTTIYRHWEAIDGQKYASEAEFPCLVMAVHECEDHPIADASCNHTCRLDYEASDNAAFIAHARADVPALCAEVRRLRDAVAEALTPFAELIGENVRLQHERDEARAEVARLREALDAAQRIVRRKADREAGREET